MLKPLIMTQNRLLAKFILPLLCVLLTQIAFSQNRIVTGKITDDKGSPVQGATVTVKGSKSGTATDANGSFRLSVDQNASTLVVTSVGFGRQEVDIAGKTEVTVGLVATNASLNEVVVVGYGTARKKDLTGAVASVTAKDFNKGVVTNPDQLLEGKVAGLQIINSSGQPGAATIVKIRGNNSIRSGNTPLYVIDGVPLDGRSARPGIFNNAGVGTSPDVNPLNFINPAEIASIEVLKDASAAAIYGSRGANGVILVTTKKGQVGPSRIEAGVYYGISDVMRKIKVLDASGYKAALTKYAAANSDSGASIDPFKAILHKNAPTTNYTVAFSGGNDNGKFRASFLANDQQGIIRKSGLTKYVGNFNGQYKFLDKKLSLDFNMTAANFAEQIAPVSNDAGSGGNIISLGLIWNPTLSLTHADGTFDQSNPSGQVNPVAMSEAYNDGTSVTTLLASVSAGYKITPDLEYKLLYGINYGMGTRKQELQGWIKATGGVADNQGIANVSNTQLLSQTITHTLNFNKKLTPDLNLNALAGFEYWTTTYQGNLEAVYGFNLNLDQKNITPNYHYYDNLQAGAQGNLVTVAFKDPTVELQSYFARVVLNLKDKYLLTGTFRADGSSKFGANNKYAYFPSVAAAWNISNEDFMKNSTVFNQLKLRVGYGQTGNQEFNPVDAALPVANYNGFNNLGVSHFANPNLKWETVSSVDVGLDFSILNNRVFGAIDYFQKKTTNPILDFAISEPTAGSGTVYKNMDGVQAQKAWVTNNGLEFTLGVGIIEKKDFTWNVSGNITIEKNKFQSDAPSLKSAPFIKNTGALHGQGSSGAYSEVIAVGQPIDVFYLPTFQGFDQNGIGKYGAAHVFSGDPNPSTYVGFSTDLNYKNWSLIINMHGSFGNKIYNNTNMSVLNISNIIGGRNIASNLVGNGESTANAITPSSRFLEDGSYMKMGNATINFRVGNLGRSLKNINIYFSGSNLFVISKYTGFDPEVNVDKQIGGIPSLGVDYIGYPTTRNFTLGLNFSLY